MNRRNFLKRSGNGFLAVAASALGLGLGLGSAEEGSPYNEIMDALRLRGNPGEMSVICGENNQLLDYTTEVEITTDRLQFERAFYAGNIEQRTWIDPQTGEAFDWEVRWEDSGFVRSTICKRFTITAPAKRYDRQAVRRRVLDNLFLDDL